MNKPIIIVNPFSSGSELAAAFASKGVPSVALLTDFKMESGFGNQLRKEEYIEILTYGEETIEKLRKLNPLGVIPGTDNSVDVADELAAAITPERSNDMSKTLHRQHKALMQQALEEAGLPFIQTINTSSTDEVDKWLKKNNLTHSPLIIKPPMSAGSDNVLHIPGGGNWGQAFRKVLTEPSKITKKPNQTVVVQEQVFGTEFAVGTVSANGKHALSHIIKYNKAKTGDRITVYDFVEFLPYDQEAHKALVEYTFNTLDALGIKWGAAHSEIMLTADGPRLIEVGARMLGGPTVGFSREATGKSQADRLVDVYLSGDILSQDYEFKKNVVPVMIRAPLAGTLMNMEVFNDIDKLETLSSKHIWYKTGDTVAKTEDFLTNLGIIALAGDKKKIMEDYKKIRRMEAKIMIKRLI